LLQPRAPVVVFFHEGELDVTLENLRSCNLRGQQERRTKAAILVPSFASVTVDERDPSLCRSSSTAREIVSIPSKQAVFENSLGVPMAEKVRA
jgi:hypothetical protein